MSLIERLTNASEGSRELDVEIQRLVNPERDKYCAAAAQKLKQDARANGLTNRDDACHWAAYSSTPQYSVSIDAALTLVPEGLAWMVRRSQPYDAGHLFFAAYVETSMTIDEPQVQEVGVSKATPALALCIAALRSRQPTPPVEG